MGVEQRETLTEMVIELDIFPWEHNLFEIHNCSGKNPTKYHKICYKYFF